MNRDMLEFERPILELETKISELRDLAATKGRLLHPRADTKLTNNR